MLSRWMYISKMQAWRYKEVFANVEMMIWCGATLQLKRDSHGRVWLLHGRVLECIAYTRPCVKQGSFLFARHGYVLFRHDHIVFRHGHVLFTTWPCLIRGISFLFLLFFSFFFLRFEDFNLYFRMFI